MPPLPTAIVSQFLETLSEGRAQDGFDLISQESQGLFAPAETFGKMFEALESAPEDLRQATLEALEAQESPVPGRSWQEVAVMSGREYFGHLMGRVRPEPPTALEVDQLAEGRVRVRFRVGESEGSYQLVREAEGWRLDLTAS